MRPIDADALINDRGNFIVIGAGDNICIDIADIAKAPTIEAEPVKHGRWVHSRYENCSEQFEIVKCSCCGHEAYAMAFYVSGGNYCPNCGARMTEDIDEQKK